MPRPYKSLSIVIIFSGLGLLGLGFFSAANSSASQNSLLSTLVLSSLGCGLLFVSGGLVGLRELDRLKSRGLNLSERTKIQTAILERIKDLQETIDGIRNSGTYLLFSGKQEAISKIDNLRTELYAYATKRIFTADFASETNETLNQYSQFVLNYNQEFVRQRKRDYLYLWNKENISLDDEQQTAIVTDDKYNLVVAAAGSGKTEVLITRIAYLIKRKPDCVDHKRILAIAYQRKAKAQIEQRLLDRYGVDNVCVRTFHKLGKDILERSGKIIGRTDIVNENMKYGFVKSYLEEQVATNSTVYQMFIRYMSVVRDDNTEVTEEDKNAVVNHAKEQSYKSINDITVKSKAEKEIMDCLLTHKINGKQISVKYEPDVGGFRPDFYLPQFDIFIEHWGIDRNGEVPKWFTQSTSEYRETMEKKKKWFAEHKKTLVETFAYEYSPEEPQDFDNLLKLRIHETLRKSSPEREFKFSRLSYEEVLEMVWESQKTPVDDIQNFITIAKTYGFSPDQIAERLEKEKWTSKQLTFSRLALHVFRAYQTQLEKLGKTDFEDMINEAIAALENNKSLYENVYDHILIDEYQDISAQRFTLLQRLLERNPDCKLFCVGDDWQSIMGFSGSNLNFFVNFADFFANPAISKICTNYRSEKTLVDAGTKLIANNGASQIEKRVLSRKETANPIFVYNSTQSGDSLYREETVQDCLRRIGEYLERGFAANDILVLTRFMRTKIKGRTEFFQIVQTFLDSARTEGLKVAVDHADEHNAIRLLTVHKCKGLEARAVFVLNVIKGEFGFPSEIEDPAIFDVARGDNGIKDQKEEERRLFYVAITRAKEDLHIYTHQNENSEFLAEIAAFTKKTTLAG